MKNGSEASAGTIRIPPASIGDGGGVPEDHERLGLKDFYLRNGVSPGVDLFIIGDGAFGRAGEHAALLTALAREEGPAVARVVIIMPPGSGLTTRKNVEDGYHRCVAQLAGSSQGSGVRGELSPRIQFFVADSLDAGHIVALVGRGSEKAAFVVPAATRYRTPLPLPDVMEAYEDVWAPQLARLASMVAPVAVGNGSYVALDADDWWPEREEHRELLQSIDHCGLVCAVSERLTQLQLTALRERWHGLAIAGATNQALAEIDQVTDLSTERRVLERMKAFAAAGLIPLVESEFRNAAEIIEAQTAEAALAFGGVAQEAGLDVIAKELLERAIPDLSHAEFLQEALQRADRLGDDALSAAVEKTLRKRLPRCSLLAKRDAYNLIEDGRHDEAATVLETAGGEEFSEEARFQRWLSDRLAVTPFDPRATLDESRAEWPTRAEQALHAVAAHMERRGNRGVAIEFLLAGPQADGQFDDLTLWKALDMFERGTLTLDPNCNKDMAIAVVSAAVQWLSRHPFDGRTRIRLAGLLSPQMLGGASSVAVMAMVVIRFGEREISVRPSKPLKERAQPCDLDLLVPIMEAGLEHFSQQPGIVLGRAKFPAEKLTAPAEEVVAGIVKMTEHAGKNFGDELDARAIENCLLLATSIAPLGNQPDDDLVVLKLAAGCFATFGRNQRARDLAEQALECAGDDPHRVRIAWYTFADIYARMGNVLEGLIGLACAFAADEEADWYQVWYESYLSVRLLRDVGLITLAPPSLKKARTALEQVGLAESRAHWLDTIDL
ncbi:MAG: hypothetical protein P1P84_05455 [Deferrisomatales bacterium]|nr:hypothetical protein [Deferrisomatales bacterium]